jgi:hypothetical protein
MELETHYVMRRGRGGMLVALHSISCSDHLMLVPHCWCLAKHIFLGVEKNIPIDLLIYSWVSSSIVLVSLLALSEDFEEILKLKLPSHSLLSCLFPTSLSGDLSQ